MADLFATVVLELSLPKPLDYSIPKQFADQIHKGSIVEVPLRGSKRRGYVVEVKNSSDIARVLPIHKVIRNDLAIDKELFDLGVFIAKYYVTPLGKVLKVMLPAGVRKDRNRKMQYFVTRQSTKEIIRNEIPKLLNKAPQQAALLEKMLKVRNGILLTELLEQTKSGAASVHALVEKGHLELKKISSDLEADLEDHEYILTKPKKLRQDQNEALSKIQASLQKGQFQTHLLFGITGSGKTEVYLQAIDEALKLKKSVLMLVPEISLTEQTIERFKSRFSEKIAILHHRISEGKRKEAWLQAKLGTISIVLGARSAIFCPMPNLGLIIVDEEHEMSYKQNEDSPCYNARDLAVVRGKNNRATVVLGSATPSLESYYNAKEGKYLLSVLKDRHELAKLPDVTIVDMKREYEKAKGATFFSEQLLHEIKKCASNGEQAIIFLNRRGFHTSLSCLACGKTVDCSHCDKTLTFHKKEHVLSCHLCGETLIPPTACPHCRSPEMMKFKGYGTEKIEAALKAILPDLRVIRIDRDATRHQGSLEILLQQFKTGKADVLIGTQMVAKGLHFPDVTLVGIINCDAAMNIPDFRAQETLFQLVTQVSGRAGRGEVEGKVILQTQTPDNATILFAKNHDYEGFFQSEIEARRLFFFPPFSHIVKITLSGADEKKTEEIAINYHNALERLLPKDIILHPVTAPGNSRIKDTYRFQILLRAKHTYQMLSLIEKAEKSLNSQLPTFIDVDPSSTYL